MGRPADRRIDRAGERIFGDLPGAAPAVGVRLAGERSVAGEGELAAGGARRAFINDAADGAREGWVADPVEHDLSYRALAVGVLVAGLVIDGAREAVQRLRPRRVLPVKLKGAAAGFGPPVSGISALTLSACCGAMDCRISGGGAGAAA